MKASARSSTRIIAAAGQLFLRAEVLVQARLGDADIGRHLVDRHHVEALFGQQAVDRRDDRVLAGAQHLFSERHLGHARNCRQAWQRRTLQVANKLIGIK